MYKCSGLSPIYEQWSKVLIYICPSSDQQVIFRGISSHILNKKEPKYNELIYTYVYNSFFKKRVVAKFKYTLSTKVIK